MDHHSNTQNELPPTHLGLYLFGGPCLGFGILNLYYAFGSKYGDMNSNLTAHGFTGIDNITVIDGTFSFLAIAVGAMALILANAIAWSYTDGY